MKALFAQYRLYIEIIAIIALVGGAALWWNHHNAKQQAIGEERIKAKDAEVVAAKKIHNAEVERRAEVIAAKQIGDLKAQYAKPPASDAPHLVCPRLRPNESTPSASTVRQDAGSGPVADAASQQPAMVSQPSQSTDYGPDIDKRFADDDALILALQQRIEGERGVCR
jgi:cytoskeletal protein RodZ